MADEIITRQQLVDASADAESLQKFISGTDIEDVLTRLGQIYPTLAKLVRILMETGGWKAYQTEAALLATTPTVNPSVGYAFDTKKLYLWNGTSWIDEGLSQLDQAKAFANSNKIFKPQVIVDPIDWNTLREIGFYYFISGTTWDNSTNKPPFTNQWAYAFVMPVSTDVVAQFVWAFNSKKIAYRFSNASAQWSTWGVFSDDDTLTAAIKSSINGDRDATFDARIVNSITPIFESITKNFFDKSTPLLTNYRITSAGVLEYHLNSVTTPIINVQGLTSIAVSGLTASAIAYRAYRFLDKDKKWISNDPILLNTTRKIIPVPANAVWFQLCLKDGIDTWALNLDTIQFEAGSTVTAYASYVRGYLKTLFGADFLLDPLQLRSLLDPAFENLSRNFFDKTAPLLMNRRITSSGVLEYHLNSVT
ncbi:pyocin knob domain-containing protein, partial [Acinetobacter baumannii]